MIQAVGRFLLKMVLFIQYLCCFIHCDRDRGLQRAGWQWKWLCYMWWLRRRRQLSLGCCLRSQQSLSKLVGENRGQTSDSHSSHSALCSYVALQNTDIWINFREEHLIQKQTVFVLHKARLRCVFVEDVNMDVWFTTWHVIRWSKQYRQIIVILQTSLSQSKTETECTPIAIPCPMQYSVTKLGWRFTTVSLTNFFLSCSNSCIAKRGWGLCCQ